MSNLSYINPSDSAERREEKLEKIVEVLMRRVEADTDRSSASYSHFQAAIVLEKQVKSRTKDLGEALNLLEKTNAELSAAQAEAEAARSDLANALEAIQEGFALFDPDDRLIMRNSRFCAYLPDIKDKLERGITFNDYVKLVSTSAFIVFDDETTREGWIEDRIAAHRKKHASFNVEHRDDRWIQVSEQRTLNKSTAVLQTDVTDMLRMERQERDKLLDTQAAMIRATLDHLNQGIAIFDRNMCLLGSNVRLREMFSPPQRLLQTGTSFETIVGFFLSKEVFQERHELERLDDWVRKSTSRLPLAVRLTTSDDRHLDVFCQETPDQGFVISFTDVTAERTAINAMHAINETLEQRVTERTAELSDARDQAEQANVSKTRFVAAVSHDLLQPLNAAKLFIASLSELEQPDHASELTRRIGIAFESVETILSALLDITKLDTGKLSVDLGPVPIENLLLSVLEQFGHVAAEKGLKLEVRHSDAIVRSDHTYLLRIIQNLVTNAIRYTTQGGVLVGVRRRKGCIQLEVWDTGAGIADAHRAEIFQEFRRLDDGGRSEPGMGLGLAIVERACSLLDHDLSFSSVLGKGSVFRVRIPLASVTSEGLGAEKDKLPISDRQLTPMVSLVVESDPEIMQGMTQLLESWGGNTIEASSGDEAKQLLNEVGIIPDVIIADLHLSHAQDGMEVVSDLRVSFGDIPAVLITSNRDSAFAKRASMENVILVQKPIEPRHLRSILTWLQTTSE